MSKSLDNLKEHNAQRRCEAAQRRATLRLARSRAEAYRDGFAAGSRGVIRHLHGAATVAEAMLIESDEDES